MVVSWGRNAGDYYCRNIAIRINRYLLALKKRADRFGILRRGAIFKMLSKLLRLRIQ